MKHVSWYRKESGGLFTLHAVYQAFKEGQPAETVFERLTSLGYVYEEDHRAMVAFMYNKVAEELLYKPDDDASGMLMAMKWKALGWQPKKVAKMLNINLKISLVGVKHSAVQWLRYVKLLREEGSKLALSVGESWWLLLVEMDTVTKEQFLNYAQSRGVAQPQLKPGVAASSPT
ncbi:unnamed protein product [Hyaloperonospora brassicae]|uniref:Uncharacterized protein n=1 Tax=Hyaloperonospora brassicae TaxID=162125 RepID=A0AAV0TAS7_HYABA|nr:unnamed protein product [Hyaloperonospora brassicae]